MEELSANGLTNIFPESDRKVSNLMSEDLAKDLRGWLIEPDFSSIQRKPLPLNNNQRRLAEERTKGGYRQIKGPAGSGKSVVLAAAPAAKLAGEGKSVLIVTINITLWHYLKDLVIRTLAKPKHINNICFNHFHQWCKYVCYDVGLGQRYSSLWNKHNREDILSKKLPDLTAEAIDKFNPDSYDAILVDEGQDYQPLWWNLLRKACEPNGEMLLVADATQNIYGTASKWTDEVMKGAGFVGAWAELKVSYRMPPNVLKFAWAYAKEFLPRTTYH